MKFMREKNGSCDVHLTWFSRASGWSQMCVRMSLCSHMELNRSLFNPTVSGNNCNLGSALMMARVFLAPAMQTVSAQHLNTFCISVYLA